MDPETSPAIKKSLIKRFTDLPQALLARMKLSTYKNKVKTEKIIPPSTNNAVLLDEVKEENNQEGVEKRQTGLGVGFEIDLSSLSDENLPLCIKNAYGAAGILSTNEDLPDDTIDQVKHSEHPPNGYVFGAGMGNILSMQLLYLDGQIPKAILCCDVVPEVVVAGRVFVRLLAQAKDFPRLYDSFTNETVLTQTYQRVIDNESNDEVRKRFQTVTIQDLQKWFQFVVNKQSLYGEGFREASGISNDQTINELVLLRDNFDMYHTLAKEGNIGVGYADMTNPAVLSIVKELPDFEASRNVVYMSNVIDHLTLRGTDLSHINDMAVIGDVLGEGDERGNFFVDTTKESLNYALRASTSGPVYQPDDFRRRSR